MKRRTGWSGATNGRNNVMAKILAPLPLRKFALKSSAARAAREADLLPEDYTLDSVEEEGKTFWKVVLKDETKLPEPQQTVPAPTPEESKVEVPGPAPVVEPDPGASYESPVAIDPDTDMPVKTLVIHDTTTEEGKAKFEAENPPEPKPEPVVKKESAPKRKAGTGATKLPSWALNIGKSTVESPVERCWNLFDDLKAKNPDLKRRDAIQAAEKSGIAYGTARTQYQSWYAAHKESDRNAAKANERK